LSSLSRLTAKIFITYSFYIFVFIVLIFINLYTYYLGQFSTEVIHHKYEELGDSALYECMKEHYPNNQQCIPPTVRIVKIFKQNDN